MALRTPTPTAPLAAFEPRPEERSEVRPPSRPATPGARPQSRVVPMARGDRVAAKVALAHRILCALSSSDPHCRLIHLAILRRDEVLLDGIVTELGALLSGERPAARTTPPPSGLSQRRR